jgi:5-methyltetrahydrofolate--homocysteine methyltransferase
MEHLCNPDVPLEGATSVTVAPRPKIADPSELLQEESAPAVATPKRSAVRTDVPVPKPPFIGTRVVEDIPLDEIYPTSIRSRCFEGSGSFAAAR